jgi:hypothetical protein
MASGANKAVARQGSARRIRALHLMASSPFVRQHYYSTAGRRCQQDFIPGALT